MTLPKNFVKQTYDRPNQKGYATADTYFLERVLEIIDEYKINRIVECGTFEGRSTTELSFLVDEIIGIEIKEEYVRKTIDRLTDNSRSNFEIINGSSPQVLSELTATLDFSNMDLGTPPDLSRFNNLRRLTLGNCKLNELPSVDMLPSPNDIVTISFSNNNITDVGMEGYSNILDKCFLINLDGNPINRINVEELEKLVNDSGLARLTYDDNILENLTPENRLEFEKFQKDGKQLGYFFGNG